MKTFSVTEGGLIIYYLYFITFLGLVSLFSIKHQLSAFKPLFVKCIDMQQGSLESCIFAHINNNHVFNVVRTQLNPFYVRFIEYEIMQTKVLLPLKCDKKDMCVIREVDN